MNEPQKLFADISSFIKNSRKLLGSGEHIDMAGMDGQVQSLCSQVLELSPDERIKYADALQELYDGLQALGDDMSAQKAELAREIHHLSSHKKASVAYKTADAKASLADNDNE
jgi:hypothetical protein